jgi:hypothetical protein
MHILSSILNPLPRPYIPVPISTISLIQQAPKEPPKSDPQSRQTCTSDPKLKPRDTPSRLRNQHCNLVVRHLASNFEWAWLFGGRNEIQQQAVGGSTLGVAAHYAVRYAYDAITDEWRRRLRVTHRVEVQLRGQERRHPNKGHNDTRCAWSKVDWWLEVGVRAGVQVRVCWHRRWQKGKKFVDHSHCEGKEHQESRVLLKMEPWNHGRDIEQFKYQQVPERHRSVC